MGSLERNVGKPSDPEDPETRIADLERQVAEQKRISELERQSFVFVSQRHPQPFGGIGPQSSLAERRAIRERTWTDRQRSRPNLLRAKVSNNVGWSICLCIGAAAVLTALYPASALWMGRIVCRRSYQLAYNTASYSYRPGQSGTSISFQCVSNTGSYEANELLIFGLQALLVTVVVGAAVVVTVLLWRLLRNPSDPRKAT